jgi:ribonuclease III
VRGRNLADIASKIGLGEYILLSKGEILAGGFSNPYILANTFESLLGCIYLDLGIEAATEFVGYHVISTLDEILKESLHVDPKSSLQEIIQAKHTITPRYELLSETGADHDKTYEIGVFFRDVHIGTGQGSSKKKAQTNAAENALQNRKIWDK